MKYIQYFEEECGRKVILNLRDTLGAIPEFFENSDVGDKLHLEIVEMTEVAYTALPESDGC